MGHQAIAAVGVFAALRAVLGPAPKRPGLQDVWSNPTPYRPRLLVLRSCARIFAPYFRDADAAATGLTADWNQWGRHNALSPPDDFPVCLVSLKGENLGNFPAPSTPGPAQGRGFLLPWGTYAG